MATVQDPPYERGLPASIDAERSILGAVLLDNAHYNEAAERNLRGDDFALDSHRRIFSRMADMINVGRAVDIITLAEELSRRKEIEAIGGVAYLASLTEGLPRRISIEEYVAIVRDKSQLRQMIGIFSTGVADASDQSDEAVTVIDRAETALLELAERGITRGFEDIPQIVRESFDSRIESIWSHKREITGLATHYKDFDQMTSGLQESELIIIAARPSMGKTAWAINIAQNAAIRSNKVVGIFSLEMSKESLLRRMLASEAFVNMRHIQNGFVSKDDRDKLVDASERLIESKIHIDDTPAITLSEMRAKVRRLKQKMGALDLIVVDYLQLMSGSTPGSKQRQENRTQEVAAVSRGLKALAKEMRIPVIALSQLSRASEQRGGDKKPMLSDLRESGSIEQDADVVAFIHRDSYYNKDENGEEDPESKGKAEIIIAKQRNGPTGSVHLAYLEEFTRFENLARSNGADEYR